MRWSFRQFVLVIGGTALFAFCRTFLVIRLVDDDRDISSLQIPEEAVGYLPHKLLKQKKSDSLFLSNKNDTLNKHDITLSRKYTGHDHPVHENEVTGVANPLITQDNGHGIFLNNKNNSHDQVIIKRGQTYTRNLIFKDNAVTNVSFSSLDEAESFLWNMDIDRPRRVHFPYHNFTRIMPNFASQYDRDIFMVNERVQGNFKPNQALHLQGVIEIIPNGTFKGPYKCGLRSDYSYFKIPRTSTSQNSFKYLCPLLIPDSHAFQLFVDGTLPKIAQAFGILRRKDVTLLLPKPRDKIITSILEKLGIGKDRIVHSKLRDRSTVYHADYLITTCITPPIHPVIWKKMRKLLDVHEYFTVPLRETKVLMLTRAGSQNKGRNIVNSEQMEAFLRQRYPGQVQVFEGGYDLHEAIQFFGKVRIIIGPHGGAFFNMNFAPSSATIVEFVPHMAGGEDPGHFSPAIVWAMAQMIGQTYWRIPCLRLNTKNDMRADMSKLEYILDQVDNRYI